MSTIITNENKSPYFETNSFLQFGNLKKVTKSGLKSGKKWLDLKISALALKIVTNSGNKVPSRRPATSFSNPGEFKKFWSFWKKASSSATSKLNIRKTLSTCRIQNTKDSIQKIQKTTFPFLFTNWLINLYLRQLGNIGYLLLKQYTFFYKQSRI